MKQSIYFGGIVSAIPGGIPRPKSLVSNHTITFTGFNLRGAPAFVSKLDLLFYNRVNELGEVLSSLVYVSPPLPLDDLSDKVYDVRKLYANTSAEITMGITSALKDYTYLNCKWLTRGSFMSPISPLSDARHEELALNGNPSVKLEKQGIAFDGWYTQLTVGVRAINGDATVPQKDLIGIHTFAGGADVAIAKTDTQSVLDTDWSIYTTILTNGTTNPDGSVLAAGSSLANILRTTAAIDNPTIKQDLFVLPTYIDLYDSSVVQYAEFPTYGNPFPALRNKHRIIHNYAKNNQFAEAQFMLQSTDFLRMTTQL